MKLLKSLNLVEWLIIIIASIANIALIISDPSSGVLGLIASITGVICVVLTAKGHISCYVFGTINILAYVIISLNAKFYGEVMLNALYYLPMQYYGIKQWKLHLDKETEIVESNSMKIKQLVKWIGITIVSVIFYSLFLNYLKGNLPVMDAMSAVFSIIAMWLSVRMYKEQWILWIVIDIITVIMWLIPFIKGEANTLAMVIMWSAYLVNAVYGYWNWNKLSKLKTNEIDNGVVTNE